MLRQRTCSKHCLQRITGFAERVANSLPSARIVRTTIAMARKLTSLDGRRWSSLPPFGHSPSMRSAGSADRGWRTAHEGLTIAPAAAIAQAGTDQRPPGLSHIMYHPPQETGTACAHLSAMADPIVVMGLWRKRDQISRIIAGYERNIKEARATWRK